MGDLGLRRFRHKADVVAYHRGQIWRRTILPAVAVGGCALIVGFVLGFARPRPVAPTSGAGDPKPQ